MPRHYLAVRTDRDVRDFILTELAAGRLRQGWGWDDCQDLRLIQRRRREGESLSEWERDAWRNHRLLDTEPDGLKVGDIVLLPNLPAQGRWLLARVTGPYRFEYPPQRHEYAHVVPVEVVRDRHGEPAVIEADNKHVHARLRASMRNMSRSWALDGHAAAIDGLLVVIQEGADTLQPELAEQKIASVMTAIRDAAWTAIVQRYHGAEFEDLVRRLFVSLYPSGRVEHWGGPGENGADLIVYHQDVLGIEYKIAVQVKLHSGTEWSSHALEQIRTARRVHRVDAGVIVTTATTCSEQFGRDRELLEAELGIDVKLVLQGELVGLLVKHVGIDDL